MNVRQGMLACELLDATEFLTCDQLAEALGCSEKTIRTDVKALNSLFGASGFEVRIASKPGAGIRLAPQPGERSRLERLLDEGEVAMRPRLERLCRELVTIACTPGVHTIETIAHKLYANRQQVQGDLRVWQRALKPHGLSLATGACIRLEGAERDIRMFILLLLASFPPRVIERRIEHLLAGGSAYEGDFFERIVDGTQQAMGVQFSSNGRRHMIMYAKIATSRVRLGNTLGCYTGCRPLIPYVLGLELRFRRRFGIELTQPELALMQDLYDCCTWQWSNRLMERYEPSGRACTLAGLVKRAAEEGLGQPLPESFDKPLGITIERGLVRRACGISSPNPNEATVKFDHMDAFCMVNSVLGDIDELHEAALYGSDYARVALLLLECAQKASHTHTYRAGLVVNCGIDLVLYGLMRIEESIPVVTVVDTLTEDEVLAAAARDETSLAERFDMLISFEPLAIRFPCVTISSLVDERDIKRVVASLPLRGNRAGAEASLRWQEYEVSLHCAEGVDGGSALRRFVLERLAEEGALEGNIDRHVQLFDAVGVMRGRTLVVPLCDRDVVVTGAHLFSLGWDASAFGHRCEAVAVLCVRADERHNLMPLVGRFRESLAERAPVEADEEDSLYVTRE